MFDASSPTDFVVPSDVLDFVQREFPHVPPGYCDYNATCPMPESLMNRFREYQEECWWNVSAAYDPAAAISRRVRDIAARFINMTGSGEGQVAFLGSATEALKYGISCWVLSFKKAPCHIISGEFEHRAVISALDDACRLADVTIHAAPVLQNGILDVGELDRQISALSGPVLVLCQGANNETGIIQPLVEIRRTIGQRADIFCDASQIAWKHDDWLSIIEVADYFVLSPHKFFGPKGVGILVAEKGREISFSAKFFGLGRYGLSAGTLNAPLLCLLEDWCTWASKYSPIQRHVNALLSKLESRLSSRAYIFGQQLQRIGNTSCLSPSTLEGDVIMNQLEELGCFVSQGAACSSGALSASPSVISAGFVYGKMLTPIRVSLGFGNLKDPNVVLSIGEFIR